MDLHGGNIYQSNIELDFSVNVNPLGPPEGIRDIFLNPGDWLSHYPRRDQKENEDRLLALIGLCEKGTIPGRSTPSPGTEIGAVIGNGASELLMARFLALRPKRVLLTEPSFYGYRHAARAVGAELLSYPLREDLDFALDEGLIKQIDPSIDLILLASPNNPNGGRIRDDLLREILRKAASHRIPLLLDACFMPLSLLGEEGQAPGEARREGLSAIDSYATWLKSLFDLHGGLEVLGAFTKTFAIPSLRLGYLLGREEGLKGIRKLLPEWNLSLPAQKALEEIARMGETGRLRPYLQETGYIIRQESRYLREKLRELGFRVYGEMATSSSLRTALQREEGPIKGREKRSEG